MGPIRVAHKHVTARAPTRRLFVVVAALVAVAGGCAHREVEPCTPSSQSTVISSPDGSVVRGSKTACASLHGN